MRRSREVMGGKAKGWPVVRTFWIAWKDGRALKLLCRDSVVILGLEAEDLGGDVLECVEEFAVAIEKKRGVGAGEFDREKRVGGLGSPAKGAGEAVRGVAGGGLHLVVAGKNFVCQSHRCR